MDKTILISISLEDLQSTITDCVNNCLRNNLSSQENDNLEKLLTVKEAAKFLNLSVPTIYSKVSKGELPYMKKGKRLYFSNIELTDFIKDGRKKTNVEIAQEAHNYLKR